MFLTGVLIFYSTCHLTLDKLWWFCEPGRPDYVDDVTPVALILFAFIYYTALWGQWREEGG